MPESEYLPATEPLWFVSLQSLTGNGVFVCGSARTIALFAAVCRAVAFEGFDSVIKAFFCFVAGGCGLKVFISGGCKNGKSMHAQRIAIRMRKPETPLYYLATMIPADSEDDARIMRHRSEREGWGFITVETGHDFLSAVGNCDNSGTFLLDSVTALLAGEMFTPDGPVTDAYKKVAGDLMYIMSRIGDMVIVSDFIYSDAFLYDDLTDAFRYGLAYIDRQMARLCDLVLEVCGGICIAHKGGDLCHGFY